MENTPIDRLLHDYISGRISPEGMQELEAWSRESEENRQILDLIDGKPAPARILVAGHDKHIIPIENELAFHPAEAFATPSPDPADRDRSIFRISLITEDRGDPVSEFFRIGDCRFESYLEFDAQLAVHGNFPAAIKPRVQVMSF